MADAPLTAAPELALTTSSTTATAHTAAPTQERVVGPADGVDEDLSFIETWLRLSAGLLWVGLCSTVFLFVLFLFLPSRAARIRVGNVYGTWAGRGMAWLTGSRCVIRGEEHADGARPAIYLANHTSIIDIFLGIWLSPTGTCGVGKKEVIWYPFFGQFFWLAGHLTIDRNNRASAVEAMRDMSSFVGRHGLSIFVWPEGTRSKDGRLRAFKKGAFHMALATKLPVVPMVIAGAHEAWESRSLRLRRRTITVTFLPPIETAAWEKDHLDEHIRAVESVFAAALPDAQKPLPPTA
ncbi:MAG: 1-acyl-sn-glycerol-3-phosphate acyltransferase [Deltaproteobacteria bacterium]|nr:1-acyl-sn-glycerol-3-phosphate acyltransferase [Deltaproteobacteria bacterium]